MFHKKIEQQNKLTEKAFMQSLAVSVIGILLCVVALCSATWAWFGENISSTANTIQTANCDMTISVQQMAGDAPVEIEMTDGKYALAANAIYKITLKAVGTAKTAYATVMIGDKAYYTEQFNVFPPEATANEFIFELRFSKDTTIEIIPYWGTSSYAVRTFENVGKYSDLTPVQEFPQITETEQPTTQPAETTAPTEATQS